MLVFTWNATRPGTRFPSACFSRKSMRNQTKDEDEKMDRSEARAQAMKLVYEWEMGGDGGEDTRLELLEVRPDEKEADFMNALFEGVVAHSEEIDACIGEYARGWTLERITRVDLAILRVAIYELLYEEISESIVINEAVRLAGVYSTDRAGAFINGVLGSVARRPKA